VPSPSETRLGLGSFPQFFAPFDREEHAALTSAGPRREPPRLNRIVCRLLRRIGRDPHLRPEELRELPPGGPGDIAIGGLPPAPLTQEQDGARRRIGDLPGAAPPATGAIARNWTGVLTNPPVALSRMALPVLPALRNDEALRRAGNIGIEGLHRAPRIPCALSIEGPDPRFLFRVPAQARIARSFLRAAQAREVLNLLVAWRGWADRRAL